MTFEHKNHLDFVNHLNAQSVSQRDLVIFHHSDVDGAFAAASILHGAIPHYHKSAVTLTNFRIVPVNYNGFSEEEILKGVGKHTDVFVVDFSFSAALSDKINTQAGFFITLDHHASSERHIGHKPYAIFDNKSSGALMAWKYFFGNEKVPLAVTLADNRDLWKKTDGREDQFHEVVMSIRSDVKKTHSASEGDRQYVMKLTEFLFGDAKAEDLIQKWGVPYIAKRDSNIAYVCTDKSVIHTLIGGHPAILINYPVDQSDACEFLYNQEQYKDKIVAAFSFKNGGMNFSLRKNAALDLDLGAIAEKHYGGGGHTDAAGFSVDYKRGMDMIQNKEKFALVSNSASVDEILNTVTDNKELATKLLELPTELASRTTCETDETLLQWLPYLTLRNELGQYFVYRRPTQGTETRLHNKFSMGLGGHVDTTPPTDKSLARHLAEEAQRELQEEVGMTEDLTGLIEFKLREGDFNVLRINKPGTVDVVHMGLSIILNVKQRWLSKIANEEVAQPVWVEGSKNLLAFAQENSGTYESWSQMVAEIIDSKYNV